MSFATVANIVTIFFCFAVLVQSVRMMRSLKAVKEGALTDVVQALDKSTAQARVVLSELKATLNECAGNARILAEGKTLTEELGIMIGIANASAERLVEAATDANRATRGDEEPAQADGSASERPGAPSPEQAPSGAIADEPLAVLSDEELAAKANAAPRRSRRRTKVVA